MVTQTSAGTRSRQVGEAGLMAPFTLEAFQRDIVEVFLYYVRHIAWMTDSDKAWSLLGIPSDGSTLELFGAEFDADGLGLRFEHIAGTYFAKCLVQLYNYAFLGLRDRSEEMIAYESIHTWIACLACDAEDGEMAREWYDYGWTVRDNAARCVMVAETANARFTLEEGHPFMGFYQHARDGKHAEEGVLTIRQLSLLSGMEELSIRAAANPKRANALKTRVTENGTRVEVDVALEWLKSKGRHLPVTDVWSAADLDLVNTRFEGPSMLDNALQSRYRTFLRERGAESVNARAMQLGLQSWQDDESSWLDLDESVFHDAAKVSAIAQLLDLPQDLFQLRVKEMLVRETLRRIERALRDVTEAKK